MANINKLFELIKNNVNDKKEIHENKLKELAILEGCFSSKYHFKNNLSELRSAGLIGYSAPIITLKKIEEKV